MIIYNREWLDNLAIRKTSSRWLKQDMITNEEHHGILKKHPTEYKRAGIIARIGLFIFTCIILSSAFGLFSLMLLPGFDNTRARIIGMCMFYGIVYYIATEYFVKENKFVFTGVTDAMLYAAIFCLECGIVLILPESLISDEPIVAGVAMFPLIAFCAVRFADTFLALIAFIGFFVINAMAIFKLGNAGKMILPFENMALAYMFYYLIVKQKAKMELRFWNRCYTVLEIASLIMVYLSGNYMAIRMLTESLLDTTIEPGHDIGLAPFFYAFTVLVPLVYLWRGLKRKNYILMRLGLLLLVAGILSIKYYHSLMPPETALSLSGIFMILSSYVCIRYLKTPKNGITFELDENSERHKTMVNIANIAVSQVMASQPQAAKSDNPDFGGGDFGGGGAGADF